jgi:hypothetical protein
MCPNRAPGTLCGRCLYSRFPPEEVERIVTHITTLPRIDWSEPMPAEMRVL